MADSPRRSSTPAGARTSRSATPQPRGRSTTPRQSFSRPFPPTHDFVADVVENITNEARSSFPAFPSAAYHDPIPRASSASYSASGVAPASVSIEALRRLQHASLQQADIIAELIDSLRFSEQLETEAAHLPNASTYQIEPLEVDDLNGATPVNRSRRMSMSGYSNLSHHSFQSFDQDPTARGSRAPSVVASRPPSVLGEKLAKDRPLSAALSMHRPYSTQRTIVGDSAVSLKGSSKLRKDHRSWTPVDPDEIRADSPPPPALDPSDAEKGHGPPGAQGPGGPPGPPPGGYPPPAKLALILISLYIAIFLVALDRTIIGPAIPEITNKFHSIDDIGWYGSAYMLTSCGFILIYGRVYTFFSTKITFLVSIVLFEIGSAICGAAPSSLVLIIGRAVAGFGSSGIFTGAILIILEIVPLEKRPVLQGLFGACFGVASVAGPLLGGAFTGSKATWRWCFYINLPLGAITIAVVTFFLKLTTEKQRPATWMETFIKMDPVGTALFLPSITCLLLALEWGASGNWHEPRIIALLTVFAVLFVAFVIWQGYTRNTTATVPARIAFQRSVAFGGLSQFAVGATMLTVSLYIPLWFQAIKNVSAMQSGIRTIPLVLSVVVGSIMSGGLVQKIGYYTPFMIIGAVLMGVGSGLLTTWTVSISSAMWISYQVILGLGVGFTMQHPNLAIQVVLPKPDIPTGTAILSLCQTLGGAVFTAVGQNTFIAKFSEGLEQIQGVNVGAVTAAGATSLRNAVPQNLLDRVIAAYSNSLTQGPFLACLIVACLTLPAALGMEWKSVKAQVPPSPPQRQPSMKRQPSKKKYPAQYDEEAFSETQTPIDGSHDCRVRRHGGPGSVYSGDEDDGFDGDSLNLPEPRYQNFRSSYRMVGDYSWVLVKRLNPDLSDGDLAAPSPRR